MPSGALGQDDLGRTARANAARRVIGLAVQLGIDALPPTSSQSLSYRFNPALDTYEASSYLGPTVLRTTDTVGEHNGSIRLSTSYFGIDDELGPIDYRVGGDFDPEGGRTRLGLEVQADVTLLSLAANYGVTRNIELDFNLPIVITDAQARDVYLTNTTPGARPGQRCTSTTVIEEELDPRNLIDLDLKGGSVCLGRKEFNALGVDFPDGTQAGVGRISLGGKGTVYSDQRIGIAVAPEFFFPSPSSDQFAGPDTSAILGRVIATAILLEPLSLHLDAGYEYDFDEDELSRFTWTSGLAYAFTRATIDAGITGSVFNDGITWSPSVASFVGANNVPGTITAEGSTSLGNTFVDFVAGLKVRVTDHVVLSGAVTVPVTDEGIQPAAAGTLAVEYYLRTE